VDLVNADQARDFVPLCGSVLAFLRDNHYQNEHGQVGLSTAHVTFIRLICRLFARMSLADLEHFPFYLPFVGRSTGVSERGRVTIRPTCGGWWSTGLWLPPDVHCKTLLSNEIARITVQIGAHTRDLSDRPPPWDRWPSITIRSEMTPGGGRVASPFGGLLFIIVDDEFVGPDSEPFYVEFSEICIAPSFDLRKGHQPKDSDSPGPKYKQNICGSLSKRM
jgi:hypothetical protein